MSGIREWAGNVLAAAAGRLSGRHVESARRGLAAMRARYDAARTTAETAKHWANADSLAAVSSLTPDVRRTLRIRSRYEIGNNCYAAGLVSTLAGDVVGTGPRLQVMTGDRGLDAGVEAAWSAWAKADRLADKLRLIQRAKIADGEGFAAFVTTGDRRRLASTPVMLSIKLFEADQVGDPWYSPMANPTGDDGIECDDAGNVVAYHVLRRHPGDMRAFGGLWEFDRLPADKVLHWFRADRAGQLRGCPELTPALPLFSQLRRFTLATLTAAEVAASLAGVLTTNIGADNPNDSGGVKAEAFDTVELVRGMLVSLPSGWDAKQLKSEHPTTVYQQFVNCILREIGRCLDVPYGIVAGDCTLYNYSSARLDFQAYDLRRDADRQTFAETVLDRIFAEFVREADLIDGLLPPGLPAGDIPHQWHFDARPSIDPVKDATANASDLANGVTSLVRIARERGADIEDIAREQSQALNVFTRYGLPLPASLGGPMKPPAAATPNSTDDQTTEPDDDAAKTTKA